MSDAPAFLDIAGLEKTYGAPLPLRIVRLRLHRGDRVVLSGLDTPAAELLLNLITGASVPDAGDVLVAGRNTRAIATDTEWLASLDRFGIVTDRAVLLGSLSIAANLAMPITLSIDPIPADVQRQVDALAEAAGLPAARLTDPAGTLSPVEKMRVHLARALAVGPEALLLEHPTARLDRAEAAALGSTVRAIADARRLSVVAISDDDAFAAAAGGRRLRLEPETGEFKAAGGFWGRWRAHR